MKTTKYLHAYAKACQDLTMRHANEQPGQSSQVFKALITFPDLSSLHDVVLHNAKAFDNQAFAIVRKPNTHRPWVIDTCFRAPITTDHPDEILFCGTWMQYVESLKTLDQ
jgi:hypothetical protein